MTEKDLRQLMRRIDDVESVDTLSEITKLMSNVVVNDKHMTIENKMRFLFLYLQHRQQCKEISSLILLPDVPKKKSYLKMILLFFSGKK